MYISNRTRYNNSIQKIKKNNEEIYQLQEAISSGKQINRPSDHPENTKQVLNYRTILANINQYSENIDFARDWAYASNSALETAKDFLIKSKEIALSQADSTATLQTRQVSATEVDGIFQDLIALANTKHDGRYLFAPEQTNTPPFDSQKILEEGEDEAATDFLMRIKIDEEKEIQVNQGKNVFTGGEEGVNLFKVVDQLKTSLQNNDPDSIRQNLDGINQALEQVNQHLGLIGSRTQQMDNHQEILNKVKDITTTSLSQREDADLVEKLTDFIMQNNNYSINLSTLSKILHTNLLDLIG